MSRLKNAANANRAEAARLRSMGHTEEADKLDQRADDLESGRVTDRTDDAIALIRGAFRRRQG